MASSKTKDFVLAVLVAALVAAGGFGTLAYYQRSREPATTSVATAPQAQQGAVADAEPPAPPAPPNTEVVPAEEAEVDRGPNAAAPSGPTLSFGRAFGLHRTPDPARLSASAAIVMDHDTGQVLMAKNEQAVLPMASLTKLMTALLVAEAKLPMDEVLTITEEDVDNERHSRSRLRVGSQLTREEALHLALMSSENRAAHALGRTFPGGLTQFVNAMNLKARQLGMLQTTFVDPTGLSNQNRSTAADLALLVREVAKHPQLNEFSTTPAHLANLGERNLQYLNSNRLVRNARAGWDIEQQKTGYIIEAGRCLTMLTRVAGHNLVMVLLDSESNGTRIADAQKMRRFVVAKNGWQDEIMLAKAEPKPERKVAAAEKKAPEKKTSVAKASSKEKKDKKEKTTVAAAKKKDKEKPAKATATAQKKEAAGGRVKQTFAARKDGDKS